MYDFIAFLLLFFWLSVSGTVAAPTPLNGAVVTSGLTSVHIRSFNAVVVSSSFNHTLRYPRGLSNSTDQFLPIPSMPFPKYGIVLLALFIVICAICCVLVLFILYSHTMQRWIRGIPGHICALFKGGKCDGGRVSTEDQVPNRDGDKEKNDTVLHILSSAGDVSFPCDDHLGGHSNKSANSSEETVSTPTNPPAPFSVVASPPSGSHPSYISTRSPSIHAARSPQISPTSHSRSPSSPLFERLQTLLATSRMMFRTLTADRSSRPSTPSPKALTTVDIPTPTRTETGFIHSISLPIVNMHSDDAAKTVAGNRGCPQTSESFMPSPAANLMSTKRTCVPQSDYSTTPSSMSINSRSGFYSLSGDAQLSPSTAFHSLIDLPTLATPSDTPPATILKSSLPSSSCNREQLGSPLSPRYVHGAQLETIHEENDTQTSHLKQAFPDYSHESCNILMFTSPSAPLLDDTPSRDSLTVCPQEAKPNQSERTIRALPLKPTSKPHASIPATWYELGHIPGARTPSLPRFSPSARSPPPPSEPPSVLTLPAASALRNSRNDRPRSVAWLQPVIDWAVDGCGIDPSVGEHKDMEDAPSIGIDDECTAAQHAADAMAAVMDSLTSIGLDPTDMGLVSCEPISSSLSNSSFHSTSPSLPFADSGAFHMKAADADVAEEEEVELEIGSPCSEGNLSPARQHDPRHYDFSFDEELRGDVRSGKQVSYEGREHGENIKTALLSFLSSPSATGSGRTSVECRSAHPAHEKGPSKLTYNTANMTQTPQKEAATCHSEEEMLQIKSTSLSDMKAESTKAVTGRRRSSTISQPIRTHRTVQPDRVYASPSSLAGLSPLEVAKKFTTASVSSAGSTPSPRGIRATSPLHRSSPVSPLQLQSRKTNRLSLESPIFDCTKSTLTVSPRHDQTTPSPHNKPRVSSPQHNAISLISVPPPLGSTRSTPMMSLRRNVNFLPQCSSSPVSSLQRPNLPEVSALGPLPILTERTNSINFDEM